jgi:hypothetical protein
VHISPSLSECASFPPSSTSLLESNQVVAQDVARFLHPASSRAECGCGISGGHLYDSQICSGE